MVVPQKPDARKVIRRRKRRRGRRGRKGLVDLCVFSVLCVLCVWSCRKPSSVPAACATRMVICLGWPLPATSSSLPAASLSGWSVRVAPRRLFGLAPTGGYRATAVTSGAVGSYPTISPLPTLALRPQWAVSFLWPCPSPFGAQALPGSLPCGARTFLGHLAASATIARDQWRGSYPASPSRANPSSACRTNGLSDWSADFHWLSTSRYSCRASARRPSCS